ncbi:MAG: hypothetical protein V1782_04235 [Pseudomonadota bacterium]
MNTPGTLPQDIFHLLFTSLCGEICCCLFVVETFRDDSGKPRNFIGKIANKPFCELLSVSENDLLEKELPESLAIGAIPLRDMLLDAAASESRKFFKAHLPNAARPCNILIYSPLPGFQAIIIKGASVQSKKNHSPGMLCEPDSIREPAEEVLAGLRGLRRVFDEDFIIQHQNGITRKSGEDCLDRTCEEKSKEHLIRELQASLAKTKRLNGLLPICSYCKKIKDDNGTWQQLESYLRSHAEVEFSHDICHECDGKHHPQGVNKKK